MRILEICGGPAGCGADLSADDRPCCPGATVARVELVPAEPPSAADDEPEDDGYMSDSDHARSAEGHLGEEWGAAVKVTGKSITDEQIREMRQRAADRVNRLAGEQGDSEIATASFIALDRRFSTRRRMRAREHLADAWNARNHAP